MKKYTNVEFGLRQGKITQKYIDYSFNLDPVVELVQELTAGINRASMLTNYKAIKKSQSAKPMLLIYPRLNAR